MNVEVDEGRLVYRATGSGKRISYKRLKKGLKKTSFSIFEEMPCWLFDSSPAASPKKIKKPWKSMLSRLLNFNCAQDWIISLSNTSARRLPKDPGLLRRPWGFLFCSLMQASLQRYQNKKPRSLREAGSLCPGLDSNQHTLSGTTTSKWLVYQFQHLGKIGWQI